MVYVHSKEDRKDVSFFLLSNVNGFKGFPADTVETPSPTHARAHIKVV